MIELSKPKKIASGIMFNVIIGGTYILGFRVMNGFILPPSSQNKVSHKYYPVCYLQQSVAEELYDTIKGKGWEKEFSFTLRSKEESINDLLISAGYFSVYYG